MVSISPRLSPCRRHPCSVEHAELVRGFREISMLWEEQAERETGGYEEDMRMYLQSNPRPLFRDWLLHSKNRLRNVEPGE